MSLKTYKIKNSVIGKIALSAYFHQYSNFKFLKDTTILALIPMNTKYVFIAYTHFCYNYAPATTLLLQSILTTFFKVNPNLTTYGYKP